MLRAIANTLSTCIYRTHGRVGFACGRKVLLKITNAGGKLLTTFRLTFTSLTFTNHCYPLSKLSVIEAMLSKRGAEA
jgi:hypothetical protein